MTSFDSLAKLYCESINWPYRKYLELPTLNALLGDLSTLRILDYGCGPGAICRYLKSQGAKSITGHDISKGMLGYARQCEIEYPQEINYIYEKDNLPERYFDAVTALYVLPYAKNVNELSTMIKHMQKSLKVGGKLILLTFNPNFHPMPNYYLPHGLQLIEKTPRRDGSLVYLNIHQNNEVIQLETYYYSLEMLTSILSNNGFHHISIEKHMNTFPMENKAIDEYMQCPHTIFLTAIYR